MLRGINMKKRILIAGIGNLLFTDEAIGVHVIKELAKQNLPEEVELVDIGTAIFELVRWMEDKDKVIIVDTVLSDQPAGTIFKLSPEDLKTNENMFSASLHQFGVVEALESSALLGHRPEVVILGVVPKDYQSLGTELTDELRQSIPKIVQVILREIK